MARHRIFTEQSLGGAPGELTIIGDEAQHAARVKRVEPGDAVEVLDGRGQVAECRVIGSEKRGREWVLRLSVESLSRAEPVRPRVEVVSAAPKGPRLGDMIDGLSQVGAASWSPLDSARGVVEPGAAKLGRLERIAAEAAKQCGRAWRLEIGARLRFEDSLGGGNVVLADALGAPYKASGQGTVRVLVGPEGGWNPRELDAARRAGVRIARFGPHAMRIETATVAAAAVILDVEARG